MREQRKVSIWYEEGVPVCENLELYYRRRLIVKAFPKEKLVDGLIGEGLLVRGLRVRGFWDDKGVVKARAPGLLFRVKRCRHWKKGESFLVDFERASSDEIVVHDVMTE